MNEYKDNGGYRVCANCGKVFYVIAPELWVYKHEGHLRGEDRKVYLCSWHCLREHEKAYASRRDKAFAEAKERARERRKEHLKSIKKELMNRHCEECRYFSHGKYGFPDCSVIGRPIRGSAMACRRFKERYEEEMKKA